DRARAWLDDQVADLVRPTVRHAPDLERDPSPAAGVGDGPRDQDRVFGFFLKAQVWLGPADDPHGGIEARRIPVDELVVVLSGERHHACPERRVEERRRGRADAAAERTGDGDLPALDRVAGARAREPTQVADDFPEVED